MTWATVITLGLFSVGSAFRSFGMQPAEATEKERQLQAFVRALWFGACAIAMWDRYL